MGRTGDTIGVIFDVDGTLIDTSLVSVPAVHKIAGKYGLSTVAADEIINSIGVSGIDFYKCFYHGLDDELLYDFDEKVQALERQIIRVLGKKLLFDGIEPLLVKMKESGFGLAVASTGSDRHVNTVLNVMGIKGFFDKVECNHDDKAGMIRDIMAVYPERRWFMVGDKRKDSDSAKANKISAIGVKYGFSREIDLTGFDWIVDKPDEIMEIVSKAMDAF